MASAQRGRVNRVFRQGAVLGLVCTGLLLGLYPAMTGAAGGEYLGSFGPDETTNSEFEAPGAVAVDQETGAVYVIDRQKQVLYKFDSSGSPLEFEGTAGYLTGNEITGLVFNPGNGTSQVAVDSETHVIYVTSENKVRAFESDGEPHNFAEGPGEGTSEIPGASELTGVAVDKFGDIYVSDGGDKKIRIYSRTGTLVTEFATEESGSFESFGPANLSVSPSGTIYVVRRSSSVYRFDPSQFPITPTTTFSLGTKLDLVTAYTVAVDPSTSYVYIGQEASPTTSRVAVYNANNELVGTLGGPGQPGDLAEAPVGVAVLASEKRVYVADRVEILSGAQRVEMFQSFSFFEGPPTISESVTDITSHSAELRARINPNTFDATYWFEYGQVDCAIAPGECTKVPASGAAIGSGHEAVPVSAAISGLQPGTKYFYRAVAENSKGTTEGSTRSFVTQKAQFGSGLPDGRVWEQATPGNKFGGSITNSELVQAAEDGAGISFQTRGSIVEDPEGNRALETSAVLTRRALSSAWSVEDLVPTHTVAGGLGFGPEFKLFSSDLGHAVFEPRDDTPLSPEASERAPYLRTNTNPPGFRPLVTSKEGFANVPPGTVFGGEANGERNPVSVSAANSSLTHIVLSAEAPLVAGAEKRSIYLWHDGSLEPVSELPADEGGEIVHGQPGSGTIAVRNSVSEDGSRVFWAPGDPLSVSLEWPALYLRDTVANETFRLDVPESDASGAGEAHPVFMNASSDGSVVFFTDSQQLTADASPEGRDLYRCEIGDVGGGSLGCTDIEDLSAPLEGSGESAEVKELSPGVSEDGETIYFAADGVLDTEPNAAGDHAEPGGPNLYVWRDGQGVRFVARLSSNDSPNWGRLPVGPSSKIGHDSFVTADASPSGRYLAFMSELNLTGAESNDPATGEPVEQAFVYDAAEEELVCASCNPNGSTDTGHVVTESGENGVIRADTKEIWTNRWVGATLPEPSEGEPTSGFTLYHPRVMLDNGRAYFNSISPLVSGDSNGTWDAYQYEPFGTGDCSPSSTSGMVATNDMGCVGLLSSGTDELTSVVMDSSASGDDVFIATFARLSALDNDTNVDVYDVRVGGVAAVVEQHPECAGEACQPKGLPPSGSPPNSSTFNGAGNVNQKPRKHCRKGQKKVKRHGKVKCVKKHKKKHHKQSSKSGRGA
jgi:hypothetical protein